ncbi:membrane hypothetical protein [Magnetospirillum sp. LM-5]|uniref:hypothetical protein n=1 Tax=Magnetospirillum sp. LM-5 TaxID=2681466 RepID=UPI001384F234|nr:hypothetical protein [Magnetospirillum sp. LM-5]CAA7622522.1 membrane hypothetical protein [Magnetospirillum sp. LM-5]
MRSRGATVVWMGWAAAACALLLMAVRVTDALSLRQPMQAITSGAEFEALFAIWKFINGEAVYQDPYRIPFAASYYNWLFYAFYGAFAGLGQKLLGLNDWWLPTLTKVATLSLCAAGSALLARLLRLVAGDSGFWRDLAWPLSLCFFFGPLIGYWAIAVTCELGAVVSAVAALLVFLRWYPTRPTAATVAAALLAAAAWSFKQSNIFVGATLFLFLLVRRQWRLAALSLAIPVAVVGFSGWIGGQAYRDMAFLKKQTMFFAWWQLGRNLGNLLVKTTPYLAMVALIPVALSRLPGGLRAAWRDDRLLLALIGLGVSAVLSIPASAKTAAAENYYFVMVVFMIFAGIATLARVEPMPWTRRLVGAGFALYAVACLLVVAGVTGVTSVADSHRRNVEQAACIKDVARPLYINDVHLSLPWFALEGPYFVLATIYWEDRQLGMTFERDGVGGLIRDGAFATIAIGVGAEPVWDGQHFDRYQKTSSCGGLDLYSRQN